MIQRAMTAYLCWIEASLALELLSLPSAYDHTNHVDVG